MRASQWRMESESVENFFTQKIFFTKDRKSDEHNLHPFMQTNVSKKMETSGIKIRSFHTENSCKVQNLSTN